MGRNFLEIVNQLGSTLNLNACLVGNSDFLVGLLHDFREGHLRFLLDFLEGLLHDFREGILRMLLISLLTS